MLENFMMTRIASLTSKRIFHHTIRGHYIMRQSIGILRALFCIAIFSISQSVFASSYMCVGAVNDVSVLPDGTLAIGTYSDAATADGWLFLCNMNNSVTVGSETISATTCKSWQATLLTAQVSNRNIRIWFGDNLSCGSHTAFALANVVFGPAIEN